MKTNQPHANMLPGKPVSINPGDVDALINEMELHRSREEDATDVADESELGLLTALDQLLQTTEENKFPSIISRLKKYISWRKLKIIPRSTSGRAEILVNQQFIDSETPPECLPAQSNRAAFSEAEFWLLSHYRNMFVAYAHGTFLAADSSFESLALRLQQLRPHTAVYIEFVCDAAFNEPPDIELSGVQDVDIDGKISP